jgi:hypothetical protein
MASSVTLSFQRNTLPLQKELIYASLKNVLLHNTALSDELYDEVLADFVEQMEESLRQDANDALICVVAETHEAAMLLVEANNEVLRNDAARYRLKQIWKENYGANVLKVIPLFVDRLNQGMLGVAGIKIMKSA